MAAIVEGSNLDLKLRFSVSQGKSMSRLDNITERWGDFLERLKKPHTDPLTLAQFKALSKDTQTTRKNNGYFIGAQFKKGIRDKRLMQERQLLTFDIDQGNKELLKDLLNGTSGLGRIEYAVYSTRTHGGAAIKLRVVIPLPKLLPHEHFIPVVRILAWHLDPKMVAVDTVSFIPSQIMYWPSHCSDIEPVFHHQTGPLIDVYRVMDEWGGKDWWKDYANLPVSPREADRARPSLLTKQNPLEKRGVVGAYCRINDIHATIEKYLSDIYAPSEVGADGVPQRYTYLPGTLSNGAVVYDDGMALHSHHGSDPAYGQNNPFDLHRIHAFGELDVGRDKTDDPRDARSYKAMEQFLVEDEDVARELRDSHYGDSDDDWDAVEPEKTEVTSDDPFDSKTTETIEENWRDRLETTEKGIIRSILPNYLLILLNAASFRGRFGYNEFTQEECLVKPLRSKSLRINHDGDPDGTMITDAIVTAVRLILEAPRGHGKVGWGLRVSDRDLDAAITRACRHNPFHPPRDYLMGLAPHDGQLRMGKLWIKTCHTPDTPYHRATGRHTLVAAVARIMEPGCKFDFLPVLVGPQGIRKSTLVMILGSRKWFGETEGHFDSKQKFVEASLGKWFLEMAEIVHLRRAQDEEAIKAMLSGTVDHVRLSYDKRPKLFPRQFVMIGTTNDTRFLRERARRIWAIECSGQIDIEWLIENRDQLFAEALAEYRRLRAGGGDGFLPLHLPREALAEFETRQGTHLLETDAEVKAGMIREWLDAPVPFGQSKPGWTLEDRTDDDFAEEELVIRDRTCAAELFERALGGDMGKYDMRTARSIGDSMRHLEPDWHATPNPIHCGKYGKQRAYVRTAKSSNDL